MHLKHLRNKKMTLLDKYLYTFIFMDGFENQLESSGFRRRKGFLTDNKNIAGDFSKIIIKIEPEREKP